MNDLSPAEANRLFYETYADVYDAAEYCAHAPEAQRRLRGALEPALGTLSPGARVLDAGGGSGNASALVLERGFEPVLVDVSPEMVARWREKASARGFSPETQVSPLEEFFAADQRSWDLIVFSSVLHHLEDPVGLLESARRRLAPGGYIVTVFDPLELGGRGAALRRLDYLLWLITRSPGALPALAWRRLRPSAPSRSEPNVGAIAEYHAVRGINDRAIVEALGRSGLALVAHQRNHDARFAVVRAMARAIRMPTGFSLAMRAHDAVRPSSRS